MMKKYLFMKKISTRKKMRKKKLGDGVWCFFLSAKIFYPMMKSGSHERKETKAKLFFP